MWYIIFDTETTGLIPKDSSNNFYSYKNTVKYDNSRMIQISYEILDYNLNIIVSRNFYINEVDVIQNSQFHNITKELLENEGVTINDFCTIFEKDLLQCNCMIAHNLQFDYCILLSELYRFGFIDIINKINNMAKNFDYLLSKPELINYHTIGSHTSNHFNLNSLSPIQQKNQIRKNKKKLEKYLKRRIKFFAYPYGERRHYNKYSIELAKKYFKFSFSNFQGQIHKDSNHYELPRFLVRNWNVENFKTKIENTFGGDITHNVETRGFYKQPRGSLSCGACLSANLMMNTGVIPGKHPGQLHEILH